MEEQPKGRISLRTIGLYLMIAVMLMAAVNTMAVLRLRSAVQPLVYNYTNACLAPAASSTGTFYASFNPSDNLTSYILGQMNGTDCRIQRGNDSLLMP